MSEPIAELLHSLMCDKFHSTGECPWYDECNHLEEWEQPAHLHYLSMAENEMKISGMKEGEVIDALNIMQKLNFQKSMTRKLLKRFLEIAERQVEL